MIKLLGISSGTIEGVFISLVIHKRTVQMKRKGCLPLLFHAQQFGSKTSFCYVLFHRLNSKVNDF